MTLNGTLIRALRGEQQLSTRHAAALAGVSPIILGRIEDNDPHSANMLTVSGLLALAQALGSSPAHLLADSTTPSSCDADTEDEPVADAGTLAGLLLARRTQTGRADILTALGWTLTRLHTAIAALEIQLVGTGLVLHKPHHRLQLVPENRAAVAEAETRLTTTKYVKRGMDVTTAKVLRRVYDGRYQGGGRTGPEVHAALSVLVKTGALDQTKTMYSISDAVRFALDAT